MTRNIYGDVTDGQGRPSDLGDSAVRKPTEIIDLGPDPTPRDVAMFRRGFDTATRNLAVLALMYVESGECPPEDVAAMRAIVAAHDEEIE